MYKALLEWEDLFEGEVHQNAYAAYDTDVDRLVKMMMDYKGDGILISFSVKRTDKE